MPKKHFLREKNLTATFFLTLALIALFLITYFRIERLLEKRCFARMEEGVQTVTTEINEKFRKDSQILNSVADIISSSEDLDTTTLQNTITTFTPLFETMKIRILLPDNTILEPEGNIVDGTGHISFDELVPLGEHVSRRAVSVMDGNTLILRHYVPITKDDETIAILYGVTAISDLPNVISVNNIYNASADVLIIDIEDGSFIMDTMHETPQNLSDLAIFETRGNMSWERTKEKIQNGESGRLIYRSAENHEWYYLYYAPDADARWSIAVAVPEKSAFSTLYSIRQIFLIFALFTAIAVAIYYVWVRKNARLSLDDAVEKVRLEEKLKKAEAADQAKSRFLSNMSHDIRTPMNAIIGYTTLAKSNIEDKERILDYLTKILSSGNHLLSLINDILDMSRIESGKLNIEEKECNISDIFKDMRNIIQTQMQTKQLSFYMDTIDITDEDIYCDKLHVNQALLNLLSNAIKFTPPGGSVSLTVKQNQGAPEGYGAYEIRVKDTGIGMSPEFAKHVFEPFEREKNSTVSGIQGSGLGMAITKSIVDAMGGSIQVKTEPGKGTEFIIHFQFRLQTSNKQIEALHELNGLRVLVVDDSFSTCDSITKMLLQIGVSSEWTLHGREAVLRAKQSVEMNDEYFAYIIDWLLPDLNGVEVARQIRAAVGEEVPIIILTAYDWSDIEAEAKDAGVTAFCSKPIFISELRDTLISVMGKKETNHTAFTLPDMKKALNEKRLLLVEDNEMNLEIAEELLLERGFTVETASNGSIAVDKVKNSEPGYYDLILMDIQMPVMDGYDATRAIRKLKDPALSNIPIVAMTANAFDDDRKKALACGMNAHVAKPIDIEKLMKVLFSFLKD